MCVVESKGMFSASKILRQLSSREGFRIKEFFIPKPEKTPSSPILLSPIKKRKKKEFYGYWEIRDSMKYKSNFRSRNREVIDKIKLKSNIFEPMSFKLSNPLQAKLARSPNIKLKYKL